MQRTSFILHPWRIALLSLCLLGSLATQSLRASDTADAQRIAASLSEESSSSPELIHDEMSPAEEQALWSGIQRSIAQLQEDGKLAMPDAAQTVFYGWPVRMAPGRSDFAGFSVSAFADHNPAAGPWLDYNNGSRTYDSHRGTDIALWPFSWNKVDAGDVQVIAAAAGTIIQNENIMPTDHNCLVGGPGGLGNWITLQHADGRITIYGHMKYNSLTKKAVGQSVAIGEYLGTVGSAGNSSGPHVHFEVRTANGDASLWTDPYTGPASPQPSGWISQRPYYDSAINKLATGTAGSVYYDCQPSVTNIQEGFIAPATIHFQVYFRDYQNVLPAVFTIYDPAGNVYQTWNYSNATAFSRALEYHKAYNFPADALPGKWRFEAQYNGQTVETFFTVNMPPAATTLAATNMTASGVTLNGTVAANGAATTVRFEYGLTANYGAPGSPADAAQSPLAASSSTGPVSAALNGLACDTLYHFRVTATNVMGVVNGIDRTFTTSACPVSTPPAPVLNSLTPGALSATLNFTPPSSNGGSAILSYMASCSSAGLPSRTSSGAMSPITVRQLKLGAVYTCSVAAVNAIGTGASSQALAVTPRSSIASTLILLLD
ncbi:hypothetical protein BH11PSE11_BH11PSE11_22300 [soil metagenome]